MTSLETNEYLIPRVPIEIPSEIVMVLKRTDLSPASSTELHMVCANSLMCMLQGVTFDQVEAMPTCGFLKSSSEKPVGLSIDRAPA